MNKIFIILCLVLFNYSCVYFKNPQPEHTETLNEFPEELIGIWKNDMDTFAIISRKFLKLTELQQQRISLKDSDLLSSYSIEGDRIYQFDDDNNPVMQPFKMIDDTIVFNERGATFLASLSDSVILKSINTYYFLNIRNGAEWYQLLIAKMPAGQTLIKAISTRDIHLLNTILHEDGKYDAGSYYYQKDLTKNKMRKFIKNGGFSDTILVLNPEMKVKY